MPSPALLKFAATSAVIGKFDAPTAGVPGSAVFRLENAHPPTLRNTATPRDFSLAVAATIAAGGQQR